MTNLSEKWFEEMNDCNNPSIIEVIKGLRLFFVEYMLEIDEDKPDEELERIHNLY